MSNPAGMPRAAQATDRQDRIAADLSSTRAGSRSIDKGPGPGRWLWQVLVPEPLAAPGVALGALFACLALTPSLLPRTPAFQGLVCGIVAAIGYALGVLGRRLVRRRVRWRPGAGWLRTGQWAVWTAAPVAFVFVLGASVGWQRQAHLLVGLEPPAGVSRMLTVAVAVTVAVVLVGLARLFRAASAVVARPLSRVMPATLASVLGVVVVVGLLGAALDRVVVAAALAAVDRSFDAANNAVPEGVEAPRSELRSGGPGSGSPWDELGVEGRIFVAGAPTVRDLRAAATAPVREPVRVYAGLDTSDDLAELAAVAVRELARTGGFDRAVLCVVTPTGRGWVNPDAVEALEYMYAGDTATVSLQYSYLPSPLAFLVDPDRAREAGEQLFDQVHERWAMLPVDSRPRLLVFGESLGSTGGQAAFSGLGDLRARSDGALFVGPPESNALWTELVARRDRGSRQVLPMYDAGLTARFASGVADVDRPEDAPWDGPRALFLQHPSDPICWWSTDLLLVRPDWLEEQRGVDVHPAMRWYPLVTFWQVTADMAVANSTPAGHGHRYGDFVEHWAAVAPPPGWTSADTAELADHLEQP